MLIILLRLKRLRPILKLVNLKSESLVKIWVRVTKYKEIISKSHTENWSGEIFIINSVLKIIPGAYEIRDLSSEKIRIFYEKESLGSIS